MLMSKSRHTSLPSLAIYAKPTFDAVAAAHRRARPRPTTLTDPTSQSHTGHRRSTSPNLSRSRAGRPSPPRSCCQNRATYRFTVTRSGGAVRAVPPAGPAQERRRLGSTPPPPAHLPRPASVDDCSGGSVRQRTKILLDESELPTAWYNVVPDLPAPPP